MSGGSEGALSVASELTAGAALAPAELGILFAVAFATAVLSAIVGMAGGITLLAAMLLFLPPLWAIPLHGVIQLVSNGSRTWIQREHARFDWLWRYSLLLLPMGALGLLLAQRLPPDATRAAIGLFVLLATWAPAWLRIDRAAALPPERRFLWLGGVVGFLNPTIGATGPLLAPFFLNLGLTRQALVGTKAASQAAGHLAKIVLFGGFGFAFAPHLPLLVGASVAVVAGTWLGSRILDRVSERAFVLLYKTVLTGIAIRLVASALWPT